MNEQLYILKWYYIADPANCGQGKPTTEAIARAWAEKMNRKYPHIHHYITHP